MRIILLPGSVMRGIAAFEVLFAGGEDIFPTFAPFAPLRLCGEIHHAIG